MAGQQQIFGQGGQVPPARWNFNYDETPPWQLLVERNLNLLSIAPTPFKPIIWNFNYDETPPWQGRPVASNINFISVNMPRAPFWALRPGDEQYWQLFTNRNSGLLATLTAQQNPFTPRFWNFNYDEAAPWEFWQPHVTNTLFTLMSFSNYAPWAAWGRQIQSVYESPTWQWTYNFNVNLRSLPIARPFSNRQTFWYSEDVPWRAAPRGVSPALFPALPPVNVLNIYRWRFNYDVMGEPIWQGHPTPAYNLNIPGPPVAVTIVEWYVRYRRRGR